MFCANSTPVTATHSLCKSALNRTPLKYFSGTGCTGLPRWCYNGCSGWVSRSRLPIWLRCCFTVSIPPRNRKNRRSRKKTLRNSSEDRVFEFCASFRSSIRDHLFRWQTIQRIGIGRAAPDAQRRLAMVVSCGAWTLDRQLGYAARHLTRNIDGDLDLAAATLVKDGYSRERSSDFTCHIFFAAFTAATISRRLACRGDRCARYGQRCRTTAVARGRSARFCRVACRRSFHSYSGARPWCVERNQQDL